MAYHNSGYQRHSTRDHFIDPPSILDRFFAALPRGLAVLLQSILVRTNHTIAESTTLRIPRTGQEARHRFNLRALLNLPNTFVLLWIFVLLWGERWVYAWSINACQWGKWERWVSLNFSFPVSVIGS